jgi:hypothetical protein
MWFGLMEGVSGAVNLCTEISRQPVRMAVINNPTSDKCW